VVESGAMSEMQPQSLLRPDELFFLVTLDSCAGWIVALIVLVVGLVSVRAAQGRAGLLVGGGGALLLFSYCCSYAPGLVVRVTDAYYESLGTMSTLSLAVAALFHLAGYGLVLLGAVLLARQALEPGSRAAG